jgi:hypothetical protein
MFRRTYSFHHIVFLFAFLNTAFTQHSPMWINEVMASNVLAYENANGDYTDWIEIYNSSASAVNLFADGSTELGANHLGFKLTADSGVIVLLGADGTTVLDSLSYSHQFRDISYGRYTNGGGQWMYIPHTTPGTSIHAVVRQTSEPVDAVLIFFNWNGDTERLHDHACSGNGFQPR